MLINVDRYNSLDKVYLPNWRWNIFLDYTINSLSIFELEKLSIPKEFLHQEISYGLKDKSSLVKTVTWGCKIPKFKKIRAACVDGESLASVLNLVFIPSENFDLPFFGADFVTLGSGHLIALDLQPVLKGDNLHTKNIWKRLIPIHKKWQKFLPPGGAIPHDAECFFSPGFLWTKIPLGDKGDKIINDCILPAFKEYLDLYLILASEAKKVTETRSKALFQGQKKYLKYRAEKDPARGMLKRFYGNDWTEAYIHNILFN